MLEWLSNCTNATLTTMQCTLYTKFHLMQHSEKKITIKMVGLAALTVTSATVAAVDFGPNREPFPTIKKSLVLLTVMISTEWVFFFPNKSLLTYLTAFQSWTIWNQDAPYLLWLITVRSHSIYHCWTFQWSPWNSPCYLAWSCQQWGMECCSSTWGCGMYGDVQGDDAIMNE